jgi:FkbM family methyltransferase
MIRYLVKIILFFFDQISQKKILFMLKKKFKNNIGLAIDVGAHHGETISFLIKNFKFNAIYAFEPNLESYKILKKKIDSADKNIILINKGVGIRNEKKILIESTDSTSATYCDFNRNSAYLKRKQIFFDFKINKKQETQLLNLSTFIKKNKIKKIDYLKIDTEGYELNVLKGLNKYIKKIRLIHFEHHYDDMYKKKYTFHDINCYLSKNDFRKIYKLKMFFRKSFEYIYENIESQKS